jgi:hypothetical protein
MGDRREPLAGATSAVLHWSRRNFIGADILSLVANQ